MVGLGLRFTVVRFSNSDMLLAINGRQMTCPKLTLPFYPYPAKDQIG